MRAFISEFKTFIARGNKSLAAYGTARAGKRFRPDLTTPTTPKGVSYSLL